MLSTDTCSMHVQSHASKLKVIDKHVQNILDLGWETEKSCSHRPISGATKVPLASIENSNSLATGDQHI